MITINNNRRNSRNRNGIGMPQDTGSLPFIGDLERLAQINQNYRTALWTGKDLQLTVMSIAAGDGIGLEEHFGTEQLLYIIEGQGIARIGMDQTNLSTTENVGPGSVVMIPPETWHNITNTGRRPLKLFSVYAPPHHPHGTVHPTKEDADAEAHMDH